MIKERFAGLRKYNDWSKESVAEQIGVSKHMITSNEQGKSHPDDEIKVKIAKLFNISVDYLIGAVDKQIPLIRTDRVDLPKGFPAESIPKVKECIRLLMLDKGNTQ